MGNIYLGDPLFLPHSTTFVAHIEDLLLISLIKYVVCSKSSGTSEIVHQLNVLAMTNKLCCIMACILFIIFLPCHRSVISHTEGVVQHEFLHQGQSVNYLYYLGSAETSKRMS